MKNPLIVLLILASVFAKAQTTKGRVLQPEGTALPGATVVWLQSGQGTQTDERGEFELPATSNADKRFIVSFVGYKPDTVSGGNIFFYEIVMQPLDLSAIEVSARKPGVYISIIQPIKTEVITQAELKKSACCDLAGCFETQGTVHPQTTNVVTSSKELRILGLSGVYNQLLVEGLPMIQGATFTYGISNIPGAQVDNIFVAKGANSVLQGFESISGQINVEFKDPQKTDPLQLNAYLNSFGERHLNIIGATPLGKKKAWSSLSALHLVQPAGKVDRDNDDFLDLPLLRRYAFTQKFVRGTAAAQGWHVQIGLRYVYETRTGGQSFFNARTDQGTTRAYGQTLQLAQPEIYAKIAYRFNENNRLAVSALSYQHRQDSWFGITRYQANQLSMVFNAQYEYQWGKGHDLKAGLSYRHLNLDEQLRFTDNSLQRSFDGDYLRQDRIPGLFVEQIFSFDRVKLIAGLRADKHQDFPLAWTPRTMLRYDLDDKTIIRASLGRGWRMVNLFSENIGLLAGSRDILFAEALRPERAWNTGINITRNFSSNIIEGYVTADAYHTRFQNQFFPDYDTDPTLAYIRNFEGTSISNSLQAELVSRWWQVFELKLSYIFLDVYRMVSDKKEVLPFNPRHRLLISSSYEPKSKAWHLDANLHWYGSQRLPFTGNNPQALRLPDQSPVFSVLNFQFTKVWNRVEVYAGVENVFDFRQLRPLLNWQQPFDRYFDTAFVWGPVRGREAYIGFRYRIPKKSA